MKLTLLATENPFHFHISPTMAKNLIVNDEVNIIKLSDSGDVMEREKKSKEFTLGMIDTEGVKLMVTSPERAIMLHHLLAKFDDGVYAIETGMFSPRQHNIIPFKKWKKLLNKKL